MLTRANMIAVMIRRSCQIIDFVTHIAKYRLACLFRNSLRMDTSSSYSPSSFAFANTVRTRNVLFQRNDAASCREPCKVMSLLLRSRIVSDRFDSSALASWVAPESCAKLRESRKTSNPHLRNGFRSPWNSGCVAKVAARLFIPCGPIPFAFKSSFLSEMLEEIKCVRDSIAASPRKLFERSKETSFSHLLSPVAR